MIPKFSDEFAWWIVERLTDVGVIELAERYDDVTDEVVNYSEDDVRNVIRRILMESEREGEDDAK